MSGADWLTLSTPQFPQATVRIGRYGRSQGGTLHISAPGVSDANRYITSARVDGRPTDRTWVSRAAIVSGGSLAYTVSATPGSWGTRPADAPPSIDAHADDHRVTLSARAGSAVAPTGARSVVLTGSAVAQWPGTRPLTVQATGPAGWTLTPATQQRPVHSNGLPVGIDTSITVGVPAGTPAGRYPVTLRFSAPGVAAVVRPVTVTLEDAACAASAASSCGLRLSPDLDGTATVAAPSSGNFDGGGWSFDAALLPPAGPGTVDGVPYALPDPTGTAPNFVTAHGQQLAVPAGAYSTLHVLGAAHHGDVASQVTVTYTDGTTASAPFALTDWASSSGHNGNRVALAMDHRIKAGQGVDGPPVNLFAAAVPLASGRTVQSITLPDNAKAEVYAVTFTA
jgi:hypothetical protein